MNEIAVRGGAGGIHARLDDFDHTAEILTSTSGDIAAAISRAGEAEMTISRLVTSPLAMPASLQVQKLVAEFLLDSAGMAGSLLATAGALSAAAAAYRGAEDTASAAFEHAAHAAGVALGHITRGAVVVGAGTAAVAGAFVLANPIVLGGLIAGAGLVYASGGHTVILDAAGEALQDAGRALAHHPEVAQPLLEHVLPGFAAGFFGLPGGVGGPRSTEDMAHLILMTGRQFGVFDKTGVTVTGGAHRQLHPDRTEAPKDPRELLTRTLASHGGKANGDIEIEKLVDATGKTRWIVYAPATTDWNPDPGRNGTDLTTNIETAAGSDSVMREAVRQAIADAGIPPGDEVMISGFSQGGMTAASLAADPEFRKHVNVTAVMTTGSPVGDFAIPEDIDVLSLEHAQDIVPTLDGRNNPAGSNWTTARVELDYAALRDHPMFRGKTDAQIDAALASPGYAHNGQLYSESMGRLLASDDPSVRAWATGSAAGFFSGRTVSRFSYKGQRKQH